jgi:hypothetical protein
MAGLLRNDEQGWSGAASWIEHCALNNGFNLGGLRHESPELWSLDLMYSLAFHSNLER